MNKDQKRAKRFRPIVLKKTASTLANSLNSAINGCLKNRQKWLVMKDWDMVNMLGKDASDLNLVRNHIINGRFDLAARKALYLDTAVREFISTRLYNILQDVKN